MDLKYSVILMYAVLEIWTDTSQHWDKEKQIDL